MGRKKREYGRLRLDSGQHRRIALTAAVLTMDIVEAVRNERKK